jgi:tRNA A-37 threonylcarbamoyl transferase component Bud32
LDESSAQSREVLLGCSAFAEVPADVKEAVLARVQERRFAQGEPIMLQGSAGDSLYVLVEGTAKARVHEPSGAERDVGDFAPGDIVGEMALLTHEPRTADVLAASAVLALRLSLEDFEAIAHEYPEVAMVLTNIAAERLGGGKFDGLAGKQMGGYVIRRCVGRGGMAVVYEAQDAKTGDRVALKMMSHRLIYQPAANARFQREAEMLASVDHPRIAHVLGRFRAFRTWFIAMEFCDGISLHDVVKKNAALSEAQTRAIVGQIADALRHVHSRGLMHRDLKPSNVVLTPEGTTKLIDFGLARPQTQEHGARLTSERVILGTPIYMSPEQLAARDYGPPADIYALGCLAYELRVGKSVFDGAGYAEILAAKLTYVLPPAEKIGGGVSEEMRRFLYAALAREPGDRRVDLDKIAAWAAPADATLLT